MKVGWGQSMGLGVPGPVHLTSTPAPPGDDEPATQTKYKNYGYYDQAHITGIKTGFSQDIYEDLLNYVKADGVKAYIEIINKDEAIEGE